MASAIAAAMSVVSTFFIVFPFWLGVCFMSPICSFFQILESALSTYFLCLLSVARRTQVLLLNRAFVGFFILFSLASSRNSEVLERTLRKIPHADVFNNYCGFFRVDISGATVANDDRNSSRSRMGQTVSRYERKERENPPARRPGDLSYSPNQSVL